MKVFFVLEINCPMADRVRPSIFIINASVLQIVLWIKSLREEKKVDNGTVFVSMRSLSGLLAGPFEFSLLEDPSGGLISNYSLNILVNEFDHLVTCCMNYND
ncbi:hypothetical protein REPUB_Repub01dG0068800 [Reevesia pubescens]